MESLTLNLRTRTRIDQRKGAIPMRKLTLLAAFASILLASVMVAPSPYAEAGQGSSGSMMSNGIMGDTGSAGGMMGMMKMMEQMGQMMDHCNGMMSDSRPNEQWRKNAPAEPEKKE
jgi:hypothetical protein